MRNRPSELSWYEMSYVRADEERKVDVDCVMDIVAKNTGEAVQIAEKTLEPNERMTGLYRRGTYAAYIQYCNERGRQVEMNSVDEVPVQGGEFLKGVEGYS